MKRHLRDQELVLREKLKTYEKTRALHRENRKRKNLPTIGIVGYTNAGKSSLFNALTHKGVLAEDTLFATLGTSVGKVWLTNLLGKGGGTSTTSDGGLAVSETPIPPTPFSQGGKTALLNDTIGFIRDLPPDLIAAFTSTLEDSIESDLLLHVVDA
jgi:GTPase